MMNALVAMPTHKASSATSPSSVRTEFEIALAELRVARDFAEAEAVLDRIGTVLQMPFTFWVPDTASPYFSSRMDAYAKTRGWPDELLELWRSKHASLKMPFYIRCRFTNLPFAVSLGRTRRRNMGRQSHEEAQITTIVRNMGIRSMLVVPLHLTKGRVGMVMWAGERSTSDLREDIEGIEGDLLGLGYHFMELANKSLGDPVDAHDERARLTPREWDCVRTLAQGYREAEVAELVGIKQVTVRFHLDNVVQKFGCKTRTQAVALLAQLGLLGPIGA